MLKRILVGVTGTPALEAKVTYTVDLAWRHGAAVELVDIVDVDRLSEVGSVPIGAGHFYDRMVKRRVQESHEASDKSVALFRQRCEGAKVDVTVIRREGDPITLLASLWRYADLLVIDARGWFDHGVLPDPEGALGQLVVNGVRPILAVPEETTEGVSRVVVAYNGTMEAAKAMKQFAQLALYPEAEVEIVLAGNAKTEEDPQDLLDDAMLYLKAHGYRCTTRRLDGGDRAGVLLDHCKAGGVDLIVMGGSMHRILLSKRFGRMTMDMLRRSQIPLFISH
ncbi:MAG: universal stress protein [Geminicoccaceae bacterium]|nr:universal stress protein [Geminicoccaceae bacterium]